MPSRLPVQSQSPVGSQPSTAALSKVEVLKYAEQKALNPQPSSTAEASAQARPQTQQSTTSQKGATPQSKEICQPKAGSQPKVVTQISCTAQTKAPVPQPNGTTHQTAPQTISNAPQAVRPSPAKTSPQLKGILKKNAADQQAQQSSTTTQSPLNNTQKPSVVTQQTGSHAQVASLAKATPQLKATPPASAVPQARNASQLNQEGGQPRNKALPSEAKATKDNSDSTTLQAAKPKIQATNNVIPSPLSQKVSQEAACDVEKSPLASQIVKGVSTASIDGQKQLHPNASPGRRILKPRRRLSYQEKENDDEQSPAKELPSFRLTNKAPVTIETVKPDDIELAISIALDQAPYTPTRKLIVTPQICLPKPTEEDESSPEHNEAPNSSTKKKKNKGRYRNVKMRKSVNCCCEEYCTNCTPAEDWGNVMAVHNRRKR